MSYRCSCHRTLPLGLIALTLCLGGTSLQTRAQDNDAASKPDSSASTPAKNAPASVVLPPSSNRPTTSLAVPKAAPAPHAIRLPPPPDDPAPALKTAAKKPAPARKAVPAPKPSAATTPVPASPAAPVAAATTPALSAPAAVPAAQLPAQQQPVLIAPVAAPQADSTALTQGANTFGFYAGETKDQILAAIGKDNLLKQSGDILEVAASPKPDPNFESFLLIVGPQQGLVKVIATGKDIDGDAAGHQMKEQFTALKTTLGQGYGDPSDNFDFLDVKATHRGPNQFMLSLTNSERTLAVYWTKKDFGNQITSVSLNGNGLGSEKGYLSLEYEFSGYHAYLLAKK